MISKFSKIVAAPHLAASLISRKYLKNKVWSYIGF